jgi:hypothetical protein
MTSLFVQSGGIGFRESVHLSAECIELSALHLLMGAKLDSAIF